MLTLAIIKLCSKLAQLIALTENPVPKSDQFLSGSLSCLNLSLNHRIASPDTKERGRSTQPEVEREGKATSLGSSALLN